MKIGTVLVGLFCACSSTLVGQGEIMSFVSQEAFGSSQIDRGKAIAVTTDSKVIFGSIGEAIDFDSSDSDLLLDPLGMPDLALVKYDAAGNPAWGFNLGRIALDNGMTPGDVQIDGQGNVYITGAYSSFVDFDPSVDEEILTSEGGKDAFIAKYNSSGELLWAQSYGTSSSEFATQIAIDEDGNIIFGLSFSAEIDVDLGAGEVLLTPNGGLDAALIQLDSDGAYLWNYVIGTGTDDRITALEYSSAGHLAIAGSNNGSTTPFPQNNIFIGVLDANLDVSWGFELGQIVENNEISGLRFDSANENVYVVGRIGGETDFDNSEEETIINPVFADPFFAKYALADGALVWARSIESAGTEDYMSDIIDAGSALMVFGSFDVEAIFDPGDFTTQIPSNGGVDLFMAAYDIQTGDYITAQVAGGPGNEHCIDADFDGNGLVNLIGSFTNSLRLDENEAEIESEGFSDIFVAAFNYETTLGVSQTDIAESFNLYPNPASSELYISWSEVNVSGPVSIRAMNVVGQTVKTLNVRAMERNTKIDLSGFNTGVYILEFEADGFTFSKRFVKN